MQNLTQTSNLPPPSQNNFIASSDPVDVTTWVTLPVTIIQSSTKSTSALQPPLSTSATTPFNPLAPPNAPTVVPQPSSCTAYKYSITVLCSIIGITLVLLAIMFCYVKPKRWKKKGKAEAAEALSIEELKEIKKERDEWRGRYELLRTFPR